MQSPQNSRRISWRSFDVLKSAAIILAVIGVVKLLLSIDTLVFITFLGILFGLAVSAGTDYLQRLKIPRSIGAASIVLAFIGLLVGFGMWTGPTIRDQYRELREKLPEAVVEIDKWIERNQSGFFGKMILNPDGEVNGDNAQTAVPGAQTQATTASGQALAADPASAPVTTPTPAPAASTAPTPIPPTRDTERRTPADSESLVTIGLPLDQGDIRILQETTASGTALPAGALQDTSQGALAQAIGSVTGQERQTGTPGTPGGGPDSPIAASAAAVSSSASGGATEGPATEGVVTPELLQTKDSLAHIKTLGSTLARGLSGATEYVFPVISSTFAVITGLFIVLFLAIYLAIEPNTYKKGFLAFIPKHRRERWDEVLTASSTALKRWLITQLIAMLVIGVVTTITLFALGVPAALPLGILAGLLEFIPTIGPILSAVPSIAMGFTVSPQTALVVTIAYLIIQFIENNFLIPVLMKEGVDLPPIVTIVTQTVMAFVFGFMGLFVAVPLLVFASVLVKMLYIEDIVEKDRRGLTPATSDETAQSDAAGTILPEV